MVIFVSLERGLGDDYGIASALPPMIRSTFDDSLEVQKDGDWEGSIERASFISANDDVHFHRDDPGFLILSWQVWVDLFFGLLEASR
jgi:hypothetical protein